MSDDPKKVREELFGKFVVVGFLALVGGTIFFKSLGLLFGGNGTGIFGVLIGGFCLYGAWRVMGMR